MNVSRFKNFAILAIGIVALSIPSFSHAQSEPVSPADVKMFRALEDDLWSAWSKRLKSIDAAPFYSKQPNAIFFDLAPLKFTGWTEYERESQKALPPAGNAKVIVGDDFTLMKGGNLVIAAFTWKASFFGPDGSLKNSMEGRETDVWTKESGRWVVLHQHLSVALKH